MPPTESKTYEQQYQMWLKITKDPVKAERLAREDEETAKARGNAAD